MILLTGDFRQTLPVILKSTAADEINACLKSSNLWRYVKKLQLTTNMRVTLPNDTSPEDFSEQLLTIGNGRVPVDESSELISFPQNFCNFVSSKDELINKVFPNIITNYKNIEWLSERAILAATNKDVDALNYIIQNESGKSIFIYMWHVHGSEDYMRCLFLRLMKNKKFRVSQGA
ncbi:uncharacterized protein LOC119653929 [Hermetia illucens]|uniref:uncharacterized protein LOC119653929 n=1 Tax=Hermetia illucens TaxID=343691 RepID=UPI0018CC76C2|nr:uncharacterized protein LOC119653929 [Hermetia illucens]